MYLKTYLIVTWVLITAITIYAVSTLGPNFLQFFFGDMLTNGWRMQFNVDFAVHLLLFCFWVLWREESRTTGVVCALLVALGGFFTCLYLLHGLHKADGNIKVLLLGRHA